MKEAITPNMHMHCHYKDMLLDNGHIHSYWLFSYDGILGFQPEHRIAVDEKVHSLKNSF